MTTQEAREIWRTAPLRIIVPAVASVILFSATIFLLVVPAFRANVMARKREMIGELTRVVCTQLDHLNRQAERGEITLEQAQAQAIDGVLALRYGQDMKDYVWINDSHPRMIAHPYRPDLRGQDLSDYTDPHGKRLFVECVRVVQDRGAGYVDYMWQWKDDPQRVVPKLSHVRGFEPWGWIVGTGIYVEDVRSEIAQMTRKLAGFSVGILGIVVLLAGYLIWQGARTERRRRQAEGRLREHEEELAHMARLSTLNELASGLAHELNQPLYAILGSAEVCTRLAREQNGDSSPLLPPLKEVADQAERAGQIVRRMRDFVRRREPERTRVGVNHIVREAASLLQAEARRRGVSMRLELAPETGPQVEADVIQVEQVLLNLAKNGMDAMEQTPAEQRHLIIRVQTTDNQEVEVAVCDRGQGVPAGDQGRVFNPFFTTKPSGLGLGLSLSRSIIDGHGGRLWLTPNPVQGATFHFTLPVARGGDDEGPGTDGLRGGR